MRSIDTVDQLDSTRTDLLAVILLSVNWSIFARRSALVAREVVERWNDKSPQKPIDLCVIDVSDQTGTMWDAVRAWLQSANEPDVNSLMLGGAGSLVWVRHGCIVGYTVNPSEIGVDGTFDTMMTVFNAGDEKRAT